jgi:hypothetical protein
MLAAGLVDELSGLRRRFRLDASMPSMRCVGYRQAWQFIDGVGDSDELRARGAAATRQLARRQLTWLRSLQEQAFDAYAPRVADDVAGWLAEQGSPSEGVLRGCRAGQLTACVLLCNNQSSRISLRRPPMTARTLYDKLWDSHVVRREGDGTALLYIDRHLVHEVTSPQAFEGLKLAGRKPWRVGSIVATADHNTPTQHWDRGIEDPTSRVQVDALDANMRLYGAKAYFPFRDRGRASCT